ncbi:solute carrier family 22 member 11-like [Ornithodoros turicata]|uniref:solute carrier family 22 member 11-like n=1 Tax=Ornithodoros turicata TaxID=34597 RepID=UPI0031391F13
MSGMMVGSFIYAHLSDWYGRKTALAVVLPVSLIAGCMAAFSTTFLMYNIGRMFTAFGLGGLYNCSSTLMMECLATKHRALAIFLLGSGWTSGLLSLVGIAWLLRDWFYLQLAISIFMVINVILWFFISESPRWLMTKGKFEEGRDVLNRVVRRNNIQGYSVDSVLAKYEGEDRKKTNNARLSFIQLFSSSSLRRTSFIMLTMGVLDVLVYYNLTYSSIQLGKNPFLSFALVALIEYPSCIISVGLVRYVRRRSAYLVMYGAGSVLSGAVIFIPEEATKITRYKDFAPPDSKHRVGLRSTVEEPLFADGFCVFPSR